MRGDDHAVEARGSAEGASDPIPSRYVARPHHLLPQTLHRHQILDHHHGKISDFGSSPWQNLRRDAIVALSYALIFCFLKISCCISLYFKIFGLSAVFIILGILLPICLKISRYKKLARKRDRRLLLPLSV
ncbi:uncharacterized protein LOC109720375 isoform X1 [Ananas comosus]|uniref:Uncharacterized protein LOC109720375 isoform X1 n=1 Tax=Ananas comosus TaxID=4615 RepID=A0A6P5G3V9_ANACO|nr:uncharacterized protein LOC109720375 isoform X1 [Ananas comosus]